MFCYLCYEEVLQPKGDCMTGPTYTYRCISMRIFKILYTTRSCYKYEISNQNVDAKRKETHDLYRCSWQKIDAPTGNRIQGKCLEGTYVTTTPQVLLLETKQVN